MEDEYEDVSNIDGNNSELQVYTELQTSNMDTVQVYDTSKREAERCSIKKNPELTDLIQGRIVHVIIVLCVLGVLGLVVVTAIATAALVLTLSSSTKNAIIMERVATFGNEIAANGDRIASINTSLAHIQNFGDCNTTIETMCTVMAAIGVCGTTFVQYQHPGETVLDFNCLRIQETRELNPLIATAELVNNEMRCVCHVLNSFGARANDVVCGLQVTRCGVMN